MLGYRRVRHDLKSAPGPHSGNPKADEAQKRLKIPELLLITI